MALDDSPYMRRAAKRATGSHGNASEQRLAKKLGGRATPGSGNMKGAKGDISLATMLVEAKSTVNQTMSLEHAWLVKIAHEALGKGKAAALTVSFVDPLGKPKKNGDWVMVPLHVFQELTEE
jgi:hypothetical protein